MEPVTICFFFGFSIGFGVSAISRSSNIFRLRLVGACILQEHSPSQHCFVSIALVKKSSSFVSSFGILRSLRIWFFKSSIYRINVDLNTLK